MHTVDITAENLQQHIEGEGIFVLDVWAPWCGPCRAFAPIFEGVAADNLDATFGKLNTEAEPALGQALRIQAIPTLMVFREGVLVFREAGMLPKKALTQLLEQVRGLDMDEVHAQAKQAGAQASA